MLSSPYGRFTARTGGHVRLGMALATVVLGVVGLGSAVGATPPPATPAVTGTPLPTGWETCVLQGVAAPGTAANLANLDEWQVAEGGSTDNAAAYNPYNTRQATDATGAALPVAADPNGFPAFTTWAAGCSATVATLLQPDMAPIVTALQAGTVSPPGVFLADVDQSPWCAPSADGVPCYASEILAGELIGALLSGGTGPLTGTLTSYANTGSDLRSYEDDVAATAADQGVLTAQDDQLVAMEHEVSVARGTLGSVTRALRRFAVDDYTGAAGVRSDAKLQLFGPSDEPELVAEEIGNVAASLLIAHYDQAESAVAAAVSNERAADASVAQATAVLDAATTVQSQALAGLEADVNGIETGLSCTPASAITTTATSAITTTAAAPATDTPPTPSTMTPTKAPATTTTKAPATTTTKAPATTTTTAPATTTTGPAVTTTAAPVAGPISAGQLWAALQTCLAPPPQFGGPTSSGSAAP